MRTFALALCAIGTSAWTADDYARHQYDANDYEPIQSINLNEQELPIAHQPALTEETEVETINDQAIFHKLQSLNGLEYYTHDSDNDDTHLTAQHEYPEEHHHYKHITYNDRQPVVVNKQWKVYDVSPKRYNRSFASTIAKEELYAEDILYPTTIDDRISSAKHKRAHQRTRELQFDEGRTGGVPSFGVAGGVLSDGGAGGVPSEGGAGGLPCDGGAGGVPDCSQYATGTQDFNCFFAALNFDRPCFCFLGCIGLTF